MSDSIVSQSRLVRLVLPHSPNTIYTNEFTPRWRPPIATTASSSLSVASESKGDAQSPNEADTIKLSDAGLTAGNDASSDRITPRVMAPTPSALTLTSVTVKEKSYRNMIIDCERHLACFSRDLGLSDMIDHAQKLDGMVKKAVGGVVRDVQVYFHQEEIDHEEGFRRCMLALTSLAMAVLDSEVEGVKNGEASQWIVEGMMIPGSGLLGLGLDEHQIEARGFESFCEGIRSFVVVDREEGLKGTFKVVERLKNIMDMDHWDMPKFIDQEEDEGNETEGDIDIDEEHPGFRWINRPAALTIGNVRETSDESSNRYPGEQHDYAPSCEHCSVDLSSGSESSSVDEFCDFVMRAIALGFRNDVDTYSR